MPPSEMVDIAGTYRVPSISSGHGRHSFSMVSIAQEYLHYLIMFILIQHTYTVIHHVLVFGALFRMVRLTRLRYAKNMEKLCETSLKDRCPNRNTSPAFG